MRNVPTASGFTTRKSLHLKWNGPYRPNEKSTARIPELCPHSKLFRSYIEPKAQGNIVLFDVRIRENGIQIVLDV